MSRIAFLTKDGVFLPMALRCIDEGHDCRVFWTKKHPGTNALMIGKGLVTAAPSLPDLLRWKPEAIIADSTGMGAICDNLRTAGFPVYGGSRIADELEFDRDGSLALCQELGVPVPKTAVFKTFPEAQAFVKSEKSTYVIKLDGEAYAGSSLTFVPDSPEETREVLSAYQKVVKGKVDILLQEKVHGVEVTSEGFWNGNRWEESFWNHTLEKKKLMNDDVGPNTGCAGDVLMAARRDRLVEQSIARLAPMLLKTNFYGQIDINTIVSLQDQKVYALELTPRFGINASLTFMSMWATEMGEWFLRVGRRGSPEIRVANSYGASVTVSVPPFPGTKSDGVTSGVPVLMPDPPIPHEGEKVFPNLNLFGVRKEDGHLVTVGFDGWVASPAGQGASIPQAVQRSYRLVRALKTPNKQYRTDIGPDAERDEHSLRRGLWI